MSAKVRQHVTSEAAHELWRVAESGNVAELDQVFERGAYVNARNKYGMTALMKASYYGHAQMVRALLERGADPNLARNDKFTALALAAFFGHTETVRILIEHGAKTHVITRCGASAQTWATRRTFDEAARCLESHVPAAAAALATTPVLVAAPDPDPVSAPAPDPAVTVPEIKTLKDPPEIWDLVHEVPRGFNPRSAFVARLSSMKTSFTVRVAAVLLVSVGCAVGVWWVLTKSQARSLSTGPAKPSVAASDVAPVNVDPAKSETVAGPSTPEGNELSQHSELPSSTDKPSRRVLTRPTRSRSTPEAEPAPIVQNREVPAAPPVDVAPKADARTKPNSGLSPQLIAPAKTAPPKGKVIQWP